MWPFTEAVKEEVWNKMFSLDEETLRELKEFKKENPTVQTTRTIRGVERYFDLSQIALVPKHVTPYGLTFNGKPVYADSVRGLRDAVSEVRMQLSKTGTTHCDMRKYICDSVCVNVYELEDSSDEKVRDGLFHLSKELSEAFQGNKQHVDDSQMTIDKILKANAVEQREARAAFATEQRETRDAHAKVIETVMKANAVEQRETRALLSEVISTMSAQRPSAAQRPQGNFSGMNYRELRAKCGELGLKTGGRKQELLDRLNRAAVVPRNLFDA